MLYITGLTGHTGTWLLKRLITENYKGPIKCVVLKNSDMTHEKANRDFGYNPIKFEEGIQEEVQLYLKAKGKL